jgi:arylsulfatase A-like enzyme
MKRRSFLKTMGLEAAGMAMAQLPFAKGKPARKPNIIIILADDLGYADTGFNGCKDIPTPNIDSIAHSGVRFTNSFVSHPYCSPSRAGLLTGRYQHRFGHECNPAYELANPKLGLPLSEILLSNLLQNAGYFTGIIGKWHLGASEVFHPNQRGFMEFYGFLHGIHDYMRSVACGQALLDPLLRNKEPQPHPGYLTDVFSYEAVDFIRRHQDKPFFLYLSYSAVHIPLQAPDKYIARFKYIKEKKRRTYAAMTGAMDDGIGQVLSALRNYNLEKDTLIFFLSDNGGDLNWGACNNPLRDGKPSLYEGGIHVPFAVQWKGTLPNSEVYNSQVISLDIFATAAAAAGADLPADREYDGVNLMPYLLKKKQGLPHEQLFWRIDNGLSYAIRESQYKLVGNAKNHKKELFDLSTDPQESRDISEDKPNEVQRLSLLYNKWQAKMIPPLWPNQWEYLPKKEQSVS